MSPVAIIHIVWNDVYALKRALDTGRFIGLFMTQIHNAPLNTTHGEC